MNPVITHDTILHKVVAASVTKGLAPRQFRVDISSETRDRENDILLLNSWDTRAYMHNPVVLANHDHTSLPVARTVDLAVRGDRLQAVAEFPPPGLYNMSDTIHDLVSSGFLRGASVGFIPHSKEANAWGGYTIKSAELLEWSFCPIGSNPDALVQRAAPAAMQKWLKSGRWPQKPEDDMDGLYLELDDDLDVNLVTLADYLRRAREKASFSDTEVVRLLRLLAQNGDKIGAVIEELQRLGVLVGTSPDAPPPQNEHCGTSLLWQKWERELAYRSSLPRNYLHRTY